MLPFCRTWDSDSHNYTKQLSLLNDLYHWKHDLITFETSDMKELDELIDLPLPQYGPKVTINQINKQFIRILNDILSYNLSIDEAYLRV